LLIVSTLSSDNEACVGNLIWLASFPKSGNTWFRVFLSNLLPRRQLPVEINALEMIGMASSRKLFDEHCALHSAELSMDEVDDLRAHVFDSISAQTRGSLFFKIHDARFNTRGGRPLVPASATRAAVYFIRNPLDVAVSFAHHSTISLDASIDALNDPQHAYAATTDRLHVQLRQHLGSWSAHVRSWTEQVDFPLHVVRYEDMLATPLLTFAAIIEFLQIERSDAEVRRAIDFSHIDELKRQEALIDFKEKKHASGALFFRQGSSGGWRDALTPAQVARVIDHHREVMAKFGYLDAI